MSAVSLTDEEVEQELDALEERSFLMYMASKWDEKKALRNLKKLQGSSGWGANAGKAWRWVVGIMENYKANVEIQTRGSDVIRRCAWILDEEERLELAGGAASRAVASAMNVAPQNLELQRTGCAAVSAMAMKNPRACGILVDTLLASVLNALKRFTDVREVRIEGCRAVRYLCEAREKRVLERLVDLGALDALKRAIGVASVTPETVNQACTAIELIAARVGSDPLRKAGIAPVAMSTTLQLGARGENFAVAQCLSVASLCLEENDEAEAISALLCVSAESLEDKVISLSFLRLFDVVLTLWPPESTEEQTLRGLGSARSVISAAALNAPDDEGFDKLDYSNDDDDVFLSSAVRSRLSNLLIHAVRIHQSDAPIMDIACENIASICRKWKSRNLVNLASRAAPLISSGVENHLEHTSLAESGCRALWALCGTVAGQREVVKSGATSTVAKIARMYSRQPRTLTAALFAAARLGCDRASRRVLVSEKVEEAAELALEYYQLNSEIVSAAMTCLEILLAESEIVRSKAQSRGLMLTVLKAFDEWIDVKSVVHSCLGVLRVMTISGQGQKPNLSGMALENRIFRAMNAFTTSRSIQLRGCLAIANVSSCDPEMKLHFVATGVADHILDSLSTWVSDENLVYAALCALCSLSTRINLAAEIGRKPAEVGDVICKVFDFHPFSTSVVALCCRAVANLCRGSAEIREVFNNHSCSENVLLAMEEYPADLDVQTDAISAMCLLAGGAEENRTQFGERGVNLVLLAMRSHDSAAVQRYGIAALSVLAEDEHLASVCVSAGAPALMASAVKRYPQDGTLVRYSLSLFELLKASPHESDEDASCDSDPGEAKRWKPGTTKLTDLKPLEGAYNVPTYLKNVLARTGMLPGVLEKDYEQAPAHLHAVDIENLETHEHGGPGAN
uniref:LRRK2 ARM repeat domain-containing protein n=1 Tax=Rhodosorus marinus TaxID=101924 RepID=A0A7S3EAF4_9RHOD|mmetsp:Transcript_20793/g.84654  ORF Transcript_20793/g.84654 Transcript_20793/m.84654 type:complete len:912 (+) Transcript_20793:526-3261(+)